ncbi:MAG: 3-ketosteroid-delta-1-dehydrogenase [Lentisphaerae bacterium ADurb.Bin242]|nr:MAG: 3-ketosteroid-delta-1-dehydrogenase [Lentisphaerae bacterium ADurb.Bin242]
MDFSKKYDIVVAGAGIAGVAAATAAARMGYSAALIEKQNLIGGLATSGLIFVYLPLCDGEGRQVIFGLAEELLKISLQYSPFGLTEKWGGQEKHSREDGDRYLCYFSPAGFTLSLDRVLKEAGVDLWLDTLVCASGVSSDGTVTAVEVENISGRGRIGAKCFVDASGSAQLVRRAGGEVFTEANYNTPWLVQCSPENSHYHWKDSLHVHYLNSWEEKFRAGDALNARDVTAFTRNAWEDIRRFYDHAYASAGSDKNHLFPVHLPAMPQFRKVAAAKGVCTLKNGQEGQRFEDSIGLCPDWRQPGPVWETPYGALVPEKVRGVLTAGRCISAVDDAWEVFRVIPSAAMTGEAAGMAAALSVKNQCDPSELKIGELQQELRRKNFRLHLDEI